MTITLGGIALGITSGNELVLRGLESSPIAVETQRSDHGVLQILMADNEGGRELELQGVITLEQEQAIITLSAGKEAVTLSHPRFTGSVYIINTEFNDADIAEFVNPTAATWREGSIYLIEA